MTDTMQERSNAAEQKPWRIVKGSSGAHRLINRTAAPKYHVSLRGNPVQADESNRFRVFDGNSERTIFLLESWRMLPSWTITVSWRITQDQSSPALRQEIEPENWLVRLLRLAVYSPLVTHPLATPRERGML